MSPLGIGCCPSRPLREVCFAACERAGGVAGCGYEHGCGNRRRHRAALSGRTPGAGKQALRMASPGYARRGRDRARRMLHRRGNEGLGACMAWKIIYSARSRQDLRRIVEHIACDDSAAANRFGQRLIDIAEALATIPDMGVSLRDRSRRRVCFRSRPIDHLPCASAPAGSP